MKPAEEYRSGSYRERLATILDDPAMKRALEVALVECLVRMPEPKCIEEAGLSAG